MDNKEIRNLSKYRMEQAKENLEEATILFENGKFKGASSRAYYAILHAIRAILALEQKDFKKHSSVMGHFNKEYISTKVFPKELGKNINSARLYREKSDYVDFYLVSKSDALKQVETARAMIECAEKFIGEK